MCNEACLSIFQCLLLIFFSLFSVATLTLLIDYGWPHEGYSPIMDKMQDNDISEIVAELPNMLYNRTIPDIVKNRDKSLYLSGGKFRGKSVLAQLIAMDCAQRNIPFLYVRRRHSDSCEILGIQFGYYATGTIAQIVKYLNAFAGNPFGIDHECRESNIVTSLAIAAKSFVQG